MRLAAVTGCDANFIDGAAVLLRDVRQFHPNVDRYFIVPAADAKTVATRLGSLAKVISAPRIIRVIPLSMQPALLKLFTATVDADIATWIDCDIVMCRPAPELWQVSAGEVVAVRDTAYDVGCMVEGPLKSRYEAQFPETCRRPGFNGGLFAFHTAEWRNLPERYEEAFESGGYSHHPKIWDQPFLNGLMQPNVRYLPFSFNAHHLFDHRIPKDVRLVHFTNVPKPWMANYPRHEPAYYYWVRYGLREEHFWTLLCTKLRIWVRAPRRLVARFVKTRLAKG